MHTRNTQVARLLAALSSGDSRGSALKPVGTQDRWVIPAAAVVAMPADIRLRAKRGDADIEAR